MSDLKIGALRLCPLCKTYHRADEACPSPKQLPADLPQDARELARGILLDYMGIGLTVDEAASRIESALKRERERTAERLCIRCTGNQCPADCWMRSTILDEKGTP